MKYISLFLSFTLISSVLIAQHPFPVRWETSSVQTSDNVFEIHMKCIIDNGWYLYEPNRQDICMHSPIISFEKSPSWSELDGIEAMVYETKHDALRCPPSNHVQLCNLTYYEGYVDFVMVVQRNRVSNQLPVVRGKINYQATSKYSMDTPVEIEFSLPLGEYGCINGNVATITKKKTRKSRYKSKRTVKFCPGFPPRDSIKPL